MYPDVVAACEEPEFEDETTDTLLNPTLIVEVFSPATEAYDRGRKFHAYITLPSLREYVLVSPDEPLVEQFAKLDSNHWLLRATTSLDADVELASIGCTLKMRDIYARVALPAG